jgi:hypothetical protein
MRELLTLNHTFKPFMSTKVYQIEQLVKQIGTKTDSEDLREKL